MTKRELWWTKQWNFVIIYNFVIKVSLVLVFNINNLQISHLREQGMCLWNTDAPGGKKSKYGKNLSKSYILIEPTPGHVMLVKCKQPIDELTVQVW